MDPRFRVEVLGAMALPQTMAWCAMHTDYSEKYVIDEIDKWPLEADAGNLVVKHLLKGHKGHFGPLEHPQIIFAVGSFPHSVMQQARTHRVGISFDVQSFRYTGDRLSDVARRRRDIEDVFYFRPRGYYKDRQGNNYEYSELERETDVEDAIRACERYQYKCDTLGFAPEHARGMIPFDVRQNFVVSFNIRSLMHFLDLRSKKDAQIEIQWLCDLMWPHFEVWVPEIAAWYKENRLHKARLSP